MLFLKVTRQPIHASTNQPRRQPTQSSTKTTLAASAPAQTQSAPNFDAEHFKVGYVSVKNQDDDLFTRATLCENKAGKHMVLHYGRENYEGLRTDENKQTHKPYTWNPNTKILMDGDGDVVSTRGFRKASSTRPATSPADSSPRADAKRSKKSLSAAETTPPREMRQTWRKRAAGPIFEVGDTVAWSSNFQHPAHHVCGTRQGVSGTGKGKAAPTLTGSVTAVNQKVHADDAEASAITVEWTSKDGKKMSSTDARCNFTEA